MKKNITYTCPSDLFPVPHCISFSKQVLVSNDLCIPAVKPPAESLVTVTGEAIINEHHFINSPLGIKVYLSGYIQYELIYVAELPCQSVHAAHWNIDFQTFIDIPCISHIDKSRAEPAALLEFIKADLSNPRLLHISSIVFIYFRRRHNPLDKFHNSYYPAPHSHYPPPLKSETFSSSSGLRSSFHY